MDIGDVLARIGPVDEKAAKACIARFDRVAKPVGGLGKLEDLLARIAAITGSAQLDISHKAVAVFCADNGVVRRGVAQTSSEVTTSIARMLCEGRASVSVMAKSCGAQVFPVDVGMAGAVDGMRCHKLMRGTNDMTQQAAMSRETAEKALAVGIEMAGELKERGVRLIATGEAGIGNTTTSSAVCAVLLGRPVREVTGRGAGLDAAGLLRKVAAIEQAIATNRPSPQDPIDVLHKLGGLDIAAMAGLFIGGALYKTPVVMDGFISGAAALLAVRLCPHVKDYIIPSHESGEPGARLLMSELGLSPLIRAEMCLGEGTGAVALFPLLDMAFAVYSHAASFADIQVEQYKRLG